MGSEVRRLHNTVPGENQPPRSVGGLQVKERAEECARWGYIQSLSNHYQVLGYSTEPPSRTAAGPSGVEAGTDQRGTRRREKRAFPPEYPDLRSRSGPSL